MKNEKLKYQKTRSLYSGYGLVDGFRCRSDIVYLTKDDAVKILEILKPMNDEVVKIRRKYNNIMDKEISKIQNPVMKKVKKLGVDF